MTLSPIQLAKLAQKIEKEKADIARMQQQQKSSGDTGSSSVPLPGINGEPAYPTPVFNSSDFFYYEGFQGLPNSISTILFGSGEGASSSSSHSSRDPRTAPSSSSSSTSLSKMTDADLIAKAQEMEAAVSGGGQQQQQQPPRGDQRGFYPQEQMYPNQQPPMPPFAGPPPQRPNWGQPPPGPPGIQKATKTYLVTNSFRPELL